MRTLTATHLPTVCSLPAPSARPFGGIVAQVLLVRSEGPTKPTHIASITANLLARFLESDFPKSVTKLSIDPKRIVAVAIVTSPTQSLFIKTA